MCSHYRNENSMISINKYNFCENNNLQGAVEVIVNPSRNLETVQRSVHRDLQPLSCLTKSFCGCSRASQNNIKIRFLQIHCQEYMKNNIPFKFYVYMCAYKIIKTFFAFGSLPKLLGQPFLPVKRRRLLLHSMEEVSNNVQHF